MASLFTMCNKELPGPDLQPSGVESPAGKIRAFKASAESGERLKSDVALAPDDALWLVEAALNFERIDPEARYDELEFRSYEEVVNLNNGEVREGDLYDVYNAMVANYLTEPLEAGSALAAVDVVMVVEGDLVKFTAYYIVGKGEPGTTAGLNTNYTGSYRCRAGGASSLIPCQERNGALAIQNRINWNLPPYSGQYILTNVEVWKVWDAHPFALTRITQADLPNKLLPAIQFPYPNDPLPGVGNDDHMTFTTNPCYGHFYDCEPCLSSTDMSRITQNVWDLFDVVLINHGTVPGLQKVACGITGLHYATEGSLNGQGAHRYCHNVDFIFGKWIPANDL